MQDIRMELKKQIKDSVKLGRYLDRVMQDVLDNLDAFRVADAEAVFMTNCAWRNWPRCWRATASTWWWTTRA